MSNTINIIIDIFVLIFVFIGIISSIGIIFLLFYYRHQFHITTSTYLTCNNYAAMILCCLFGIDTYIYNLYGDLFQNNSFNNWWCHARGYLVSVVYSSLYHSYVIQACFRLFRIVFYKYKYLQNHRFMIRLVLIQWLIDFIVYIPALFLHYFEYTPNYYYCQLVYTDIRVSMYTGVIAYIFPMNAIGLIYFYIVHCIKRMGNLAIYPNRQQSNQRDLTVLRQIIILVSMLCMMGLPATSLYLWYIITGYLYPLIYQLQWLAFAISLSILPILTVFLTRQLRELFYRAFRRGHHIHPIIVIQQHNLN